MNIETIIDPTKVQGTGNNLYALIKVDQDDAEDTTIQLWRADPQRTMAKFLIQYTAWSSYEVLSHPKDCDEERFYVEVEASSELEAVNKHLSEEWGIGNYYERPLLSQEELDTLLEGDSEDIGISDPWIEDFSVTEI